MYSVIPSARAVESGVASAVPAAGTADDVTGTTWSLETDCVACHSSEAESMEDVGALVAQHAVLGLEACVACHDDADGKLAKAHANYLTSTKIPKRLSKSTVSVETCTLAGCHDIESLAESTEETALLEDTKGTQVNAHAILLEETHEGNLTCVSCHTMHVVYAAGSDADANVGDAGDDSVASDDSVTSVTRTDKTDVGDIDDVDGGAEALSRAQATLNNAMETCTVCHHEEVFECYTCHV